MSTTSEYFCVQRRFNEVTLLGRQVMQADEARTEPRQNRVQVRKVYFVARIAEQGVENDGQRRSREVNTTR